MSDNVHMQQQLNIELSEEVAQGIYSNLAVITHSSSEFVIDFDRIMPGIPKANVKSRIILTPEHAKRLLLALQDNLKKKREILSELKQLLDQTESISNSFDRLHELQSQWRSIGLVPTAHIDELWKMLFQICDRFAVDFNYMQISLGAVEKKLRKNSGSRANFQNIRKFSSEAVNNLTRNIQVGKKMLTQVFFGSYYTHCFPLCSFLLKPWFLLIQ